MRVLPGTYRHKTTGTIYKRVTEQNGIYTVTNERGASYFVDPDKFERVNSKEISIPAHATMSMHFTVAELEKMLGNAKAGGSVEVVFDIERRIILR